MKRGFLVAGAISAAVWLTACIDGGNFGASVHETVDESRPLSPKGEFSLENTNGRVRVATWDEPRVRIEATKSAGSRRALDELQVVIESAADRVSVRTRQPHHHGFSFGRGGGVEYDVTVPRGARVSLRNVNGKVEVDGLAGALRASTVNGTVEANELGGEVEASTTNGSVEVQMTRVDPSGHNRLSTTNGSLRLVLPSDVGADVEAHTVNGQIRCDFDLPAGAQVSRKRLEGRIGGGGARFELRTVNGSAHIDRGLASASAAPAKPQAEAIPGSPTTR